jgi:hypothetical protein
MRKRERDNTAKQRKRDTDGRCVCGGRCIEREILWGDVPSLTYARTHPICTLFCLRRMIEKERTRRKNNIDNVQSISFCRTLKSTSG